MFVVTYLPDITQCSLLHIYQRYEASLCLLLQSHGRLHILNVHGFTWFLLRWRLFPQIVAIYCR